MINNLFEIAINNGETADFFRGKGRYFVASPDYEGHVHGALIGGHARTYAEKSIDNSNKFDSEFIKFIKDLDISAEDVNHLLANLSAYYSQRSRNGFSDSKLFDHEGKLEVTLLREFFGKVFGSPLVNEVGEAIQRHAKFIEKKGSKLLVDIVTKAIQQ